MSKESMVTGILIEELTVIEVCQKFNIPKTLLEELVEYGFFDTQTTDLERMTFDQKSIRRMEAAFRLHRDLGINLAGVALVLDLLDEMDSLRKELEVLRRF